ncbi:alkaline phosphatase family protein [Rhodopila sp.]|uniref:alkaline phosphatase family protein n=1 Tax=Rhodopila sp. TaxID=2480087 RepID=UPI003D0BA125
MDIRHVVVLMLENRSFDCMLGTLYPSNDRFDGLTGTERNVWHKADGTQQTTAAWTSPDLTQAGACIPDPDPGESFDDIHTQLHGLTSGGPNMSGFVDNYMRQPPDKSATDPPFDPAATMHCFTPEALPAMSTLARAFGVSDRWHASAPCQTWPNRFFTHAATAGGYINNAPTHFPYRMETVFNRLESVKQTWRVYFHDIPQSAALAKLWTDIPTHFHHYEEDFARDAASGSLPAYSFIEPRYFTDTVLGKMPNDQHPPHDVSHGDALIASVYNAVRTGPGWKNTLLIVTYDEHGGCYDHVPPPPAVSPDDLRPDGFDFGSFGVRVPALIISSYVKPGSVIRPHGPTPFDHTSISATLGRLFGFPPLTRRDAAAPDLLEALTGDGGNDGPPVVQANEATPGPAQIARSAARQPNSMQHALNAAALRLPAAGADIAAHVHGLASTPDPSPAPGPVAMAAETVAAKVRAFLGRL